MRKLFLLLLILVVASEVRAAEPVRRAQEELRRRNLFFGDVDGKETPELAMALRLYQTRKSASCPECRHDELRPSREDVRRGRI